MKDIKIVKHIDELNRELNEIYHVVDKEKRDVEQELKAIISECSNTKYHQGQFDAYKTLVMHYIVNNQGDEAFAFLRKAKVLVEYGLVGKENYPDLCITYIIYYIDTDGDFESGAEFYEKGNAFAQKFSNENALMRLKANFAVMNVANNHYETALDLLLSTKSYYESSGQDFLYDHFLYNIGVCYEGLDNFDSAIEYYEQSYSIALKIEDPRGLNHAGAGLIKLYVAKGYNEKAIEVAKRNIQIAIKNKNMREEILSIIELGKVYHMIKQYRDAYTIMKSIEDKIQKVKRYYIRRNYYEFMPKISASVNRYKEAYHYETLFHEMEMERLLKDGQDKLHKAYENEYRKTIATLKTIASIGKDITSCGTLDTVITILYETLKEIMPVDAVGINRLVDTTLHYDNFYLEGIKLSILESNIDNITTFGDWVVKNDQEIFISNIHEEYEKYLSKVKIETVHDDDGVEYKLECRSIMYAPLKFNDELIGSFTLQSYEKNAYTFEEQEVFRVISSYVAIALNNTLEN